MPTAPSPLSLHLRELISHSGPIPFRQFMAEALYDSQWGYYASGRAEIGRKGDFITSVSVGPLFGTLLARQFAEMWERMGCPSRFDLIEQGAHRGDFSFDLLCALQRITPECFQASQLTLLEPTGTQELAQRERLTPFGQKVRWVADLGALPQFTGVHFSNELLDAFPVHRVTWSGEAWSEQFVDWQDERFVFCLGPIRDDALKARLALLPTGLPRNYTTEINLAALTWMDQLAAKLERGYVLAIDYGYSRSEFYRPERAQGTLTAYSEQRQSKDPLLRPGEVDLTAHVDFTSLVERAESHGLGLLGFTDQHHFMVGLSQLHFVAEQAPGPEQARELRAFKTLMHPTLLGTSFKVVCLQRGLTEQAPLAGLSYARNSREILGLEQAPMGG